jgi:large subunit ribosomal protein L21
MFAVVEIAGIQFRVEKKEKVRVPLLKGNPGDKVEFTNILLGGKEGQEKVGTPYIEGMVGAKIIEHGKDKKILVFHKKRRKGYRKLNGHRQNFSLIEITDIKFGKATKTEDKPKEKDEITKTEVKTDVEVMEQPVKEPKPKKKAEKAEKSEAKPKKKTVVKEKAEKPLKKKAKSEEKDEKTAKPKAKKTEKEDKEKKIKNNK